MKILGEALKLFRRSGLVEEDCLPNQEGKIQRHLRAGTRGVPPKKNTALVRQSKVSARIRELAPQWKVRQRLHRGFVTALAVRVLEKLRGEPAVRSAPDDLPATPNRQLIRSIGTTSAIASLGPIYRS